MSKSFGFSICLASVLMLACASERSASQSEPAATAPDSSAERRVIVDHIIIGISDLDEGMRQLEERTGVRAVVGGEHPGRGTRNALISLGAGHYLELLAPAPGGVIDECDDPAGELETFSEPTPMGWAASTADIDDLAARLVAAGYEVEGPVSGSRVKPDGSVLEWRTLMIVEPWVEGAPFFIEWGEAAVHPSESSPTGCELAALKMRDPDAVALLGIIDVLGLDVVVTQGDRPGFEFSLECPTGIVHFSNLEDLE